MLATILRVFDHIFVTARITIARLEFISKDRMQRCSTNTAAFLHWRDFSEQVPAQAEEHTLSCFLQQFSGPMRWERKIWKVKKIWDGFSALFWWVPPGLPPNSKVNQTWHNWTQVMCSEDILCAKRILWMFWVSLFYSFKGCELWVG